MEPHAIRSLTAAEIAHFRERADEGAFMDNLALRMAVAHFDVQQAEIDRLKQEIESLRQKMSHP